jgi:hypothetical protein
MSNSLTDRILGVSSSYDRSVITGTLPTVCYAEGMTRFLYASGIRIFDYRAFDQRLRDRVRDGVATGSDWGNRSSTLRRAMFARISADSPETGNHSTAGSGFTVLLPSNSVPVNER